jgi:hypothetical protein
VSHARAYELSANGDVNGADTVGNYPDDDFPRLLVAAVYEPNNVM